MIKIAILVALVGIVLSSGGGRGQDSGYPPKPKKIRYPTAIGKYANTTPKPKYEAGYEQTYNKGYETVQEYRELPEPTLDQIKEILPWEEYEIVPDVIDEPPKEIAQVRNRKKISKK